MPGIGPPGNAKESFNLRIIAIFKKNWSNFHVEFDLFAEKTKFLRIFSKRIFNKKLWRENKIVIRQRNGLKCEKDWVPGQKPLWETILWLKIVIRDMPSLQGFSLKKSACWWFIFERTSNCL